MYFQSREQRKTAAEDPWKTGNPKAYPIRWRKSFDESDSWIGNGTGKFDSLSGNRERLGHNLNKLQQNETTLKTLQQQLAYKKTEIPTVDEDTYRKLVKQFKHYMSHVKSPEASALKAAAIQDIKIQKEDIIVKFCEGVPIDKETEAYFHLQ